MKNKKTINSIGIILDGNRRWAVEKGMSKISGHKYGAENVEKLIQWAQEENIKNIVLYVFSTENWKRSEIEVKTLVLLLEKWLIKKTEELNKNNIAINFIGDTKRFSKKLQKLMKDTEKKTAKNKTKVFLAVSYGGRLEIIEAIKKISQELSKQEIKKISAEKFAKYLWSSELPDPEIIIRTGGDKRLSNFLT